MKKITTLFLTILIASQSTQIAFANNANKTFLNRNAIGIATIIGGIAELKDMSPKTKTICNSLALVFLLYRSAEKLPHHTRTMYRSRNDFSLLEGLYSLSAATFIATSLIKSAKQINTREAPASAA